MQFALEWLLTCSCLMPWLTQFHGCLQVLDCKSQSNFFLKVLGGWKSNETLCFFAKSASGGHVGNLVCATGPVFARFISDASFAVWCSQFALERLVDDSRRFVQVALRGVLCKLCTMGFLSKPDSEMSRANRRESGIRQGCQE